MLVRDWETLSSRVCNFLRYSDREVWVCDGDGMGRSRMFCCCGLKSPSFPTGSQSFRTGLTAFSSFS